MSTATQNSEMNKTTNLKEKTHPKRNMLTSCRCAHHMKNIVWLLPKTWRTMHTEWPTRAPLVATWMRVLRTMFWITWMSEHWSIVRQHSEIAFLMIICCTETSSGGRFSYFLKIDNDDPWGSRITPKSLLWLLGITRVPLDIFYFDQSNHHIFKKVGGFEKYTCSRFTTVNPNVPTTFFGYHCLGQVFDFIPWDIIRYSKSVPKSPETRWKSEVRIWALGQSGGPRRPGGECFAPWFSSCVKNVS